MSIMEVVTKTSIILSFTVILVALSRRSSAAARYFIWLTGLCGALALPAVLYVVPSLSIPISVAAKPTTVLLGNSLLESSTQPEIDLPAPELPAPAALPQWSPATSAPPAALPLSWPAAIWLIGALVVAARSAWSIGDMVKLRRGLRPVTDSRLLELFSSLRRQLSLATKISLRHGSESMPPMTWGVVRHTILLPEEASGWSAERVRVVLTHELAHVARKDAAMQFVIYGALSIYWFNPLVWYAAKRMRIEREYACDDQVLNTGFDVEGYATHLVEIARSAVATRTVAVCMAHPSHFEKRIRTLLDIRTNRAAFSRLGKSSLAAAAAIFVLATASAQVTAFPSSPLSLITSAPSLPAPESGSAVTTEQSASTRPVPANEDTSDISIGISGHVSERIPSPWDYPRPDMFHSSIERSSKGAVLIPFAIYRDGYDTRVSVKHLPVGSDAGRVRVGLYSEADSLHAAAPNLIIKTAGGKPIGSGLKADGTLAAGSTWTTTVSELLRAAAGPADFYGYIFIDTPFRDVEIDVRIIKPDGTELSTPTLSVGPYGRSGQRIVAQGKRDQELPKFEAATVKLMDPNAPIRVGVEVYPGGRTVISGLTLKGLIATAFQLSFWQVSGGDSWMSKDVYKVEASPGADAAITDLRHSLFGIEDEHLRQMLQALLIDRFQLQFHRETRTGDVYLLERNDKPLKLRRLELLAQNNEQSQREDPLRRLTSSIGYAGGKWRIWASAMPQLAKFASDFVLHVPVLDRTQLDGAFEYWQEIPDIDPCYGCDSTDSFLRLMADVGLKLERSKGPTETLVIDNAAKASAN